MADSNANTFLLGSAEAAPIVGPFFAGLHQDWLAKRINPVRPTYTIPQGIGNNVSMYQNMADSSRMPGYGYAQNNVYQNQAQLVRAALQSGGSAGDILASLGGIGNNTNSALNNLAQQGANYQVAAKDKLAQANNTMADYENEAFDYNQNQPYEQQYARKMALQGAALGNYNTAGQNVNQAMQSIMGMMK